MSCHPPSRTTQPFLFYRCVYGGMCIYGSDYIIQSSLIMSTRLARQLIGISLMASALEFYVQFVSELFGRSWFLSLTMNRIAAAYSSVCMELLSIYRQKCQCRNLFFPKKRPSPNWRENLSVLVCKILQCLSICIDGAIDTRICFMT